MADVDHYNADVLAAYDPADAKSRDEDDNTCGRWPDCGDCKVTGCPAHKNFGRGDDVAEG